MKTVYIYAYIYERSGLNAGNMRPVNISSTSNTSSE